ncbi:MAG: DUF4255 domain-containing protein, partial [Verrucomicrobiales bacterium]|nr:DUF4255 domain-containing protein [Verrucomicrobiales bacterium]
MSNALAIASVTAVLKDLLNNGVIDHDLTSSVGEVTVTALPPDRIDIAPGTARSQLNLFLYQVSPNQGWRNVGLPSHNSRGDRVSNPPLALDLHYLLTAYGADEMHCEILLGYGMQWFHETPVLTRDAIRTALAPPTPVSGTGGLPASLQGLATSELAEQVEQIKITLESLNTEEISKLWTAFQAKYRPTAAYQVSVVLIQSKSPTRPVLPVRARNLYVVPFRNPVIDQIKSQEDDTAPIVANQPILSGHNLVIVGRQLRGDDMRVNVGGFDVIPANEDVTDTQIVLPIPEEAEAGLQGVQVIHRVLMGSPPTPHSGVGSNLAAFVLRPSIQTIDVTDVVGSGSELRSANVEVTLDPPVGATQRVVLLLNEVPPPIASPPEIAEPPLAYSFEGPTMALLSPPAPTSNVIIPITDVQAGTYLVRVQVDGAESPL